MAKLHLTHAPTLQSQAQLLVLPVNNAGIILNPVIARCKTLYADNYRKYRKACLDNNLPVGSSLLVKRQLDLSGLSASSNRNQPVYISNLAVSDHPYHPIRLRWLSAALDELSGQLFKLIRYDGLRVVALLATPLIYSPSATSVSSSITVDGSVTPHDSLTPELTPELNTPVLDWHTDILPLIKQKLGELPRVRIEVHLPKTIAI